MLFLIVLLKDSISRRSGTANLVQMRLQTSYFCHLLRPSLVHHEVHSPQRCISSRQMTDNIFVIETTALAHVACALQESGILLTDFAAAYPSVNPGSSLCLRTLGCPALSVASCEVFFGTSSHTWNLREQNEDTSLWPEECDTVVLRVVSFLQWPLTRSSDGSKSQLSRRTGFLAACTMRLH